MALLHESYETLFRIRCRWSIYASWRSHLPCRTWSTTLSDPAYRALVIQRFPDLHQKESGANSSPALHTQPCVMFFFLFISFIVFSCFSLYIAQQTFPYRPSRYCFLFSFTPLFFFFFLKKKKKPSIFLSLISSHQFFHLLKKKKKKILYSCTYLRYNKKGRLSWP